MMIAEEGGLFVLPMYPRSVRNYFDSRGRAKDLDEIVASLGEDPQEFRRVIIKSTNHIDALFFLNFLEAAEKGSGDPDFLDNNVIEAYHNQGKDVDSGTSDYIIKYTVARRAGPWKLAKNMPVLGKIFGGQPVDVLDLVLTASDVSDNLVSASYFLDPNSPEAVMVYQYNPEFNPTEILCRANQAFLRHLPLYVHKDAEPIEVEEISCGAGQKGSACVYRLKFTKKLARSQILSHKMSRDDLLQQLRTARVADLEERESELERAIHALQKLNAELENANHSLAQEIGRRKKAEAAAMRANAMETSRDLLRQLGHDVNNYLSVAIGNGDLLKTVLLGILDDYESPEKLAEALNGPKGNEIYSKMKGVERFMGLVESSLKSVSKMVTQMRSLGMEEHPHVGPVDLNETIRKTAADFGYGGYKHIKVDMDLCGSPCTITGDSVEIKRALLNLLLNSAYAINGKEGEIKIATRRVTVDKSFSEFYSNFTPGEYLKVTVADNGCGIPDEIKGKVFNPFFTTKGEKGSGLGLPSVYAIVEKYKGAIDLESEVGKGTEFTIWIPLAEDKYVPRDGTDVHKVNVSPEKRSEMTVLLVEDEDDVRNPLRTNLLMAGYNVLTASNTNEAVEALKAHHVDFSLIDYAIPGNGGKHVYMQTRKGAKSAFYSATEPSVIREDVGDKGVMVIAKPKNSNEIRTIIDFELFSGA